MTSVITGVREPLRRSISERTGAKPQRAPYGPTLTLTVTLAVACFLLVMSLVLLIVHPAGSGALETVIIRQRQSAKTALYVIAFAVIVPLAVIAVPRLADAVADSPNGTALPSLAGFLGATLAAAVILIRLSAHLPWGDGVAVVLTGVGMWSALAAAALARAANGRPWPLLLKWGRSNLTVTVIAGALAFGTLVCVTALESVSALALALGALAALGVLAARDRVHLTRLGRWPGTGIDIVIALILLLAVPNVVVFQPSPGIPNAFFEPGVIQFHQNWLLGPTNELLGGGALLVNVPVSQYGVGFIYFLAGWFHIAPIGYGTYGLLDGILTALFYIGGYCLLRISGAGRTLAGATLALGVVALIYNLYYAVGELPQQGPLRFGLPMVVIIALAIAARWPGGARIARIAAFLALGLAAIWSVEAFGYTAVTFAAMAALEAWLLPGGGRRRWLLREFGFAAAACIGAHLLLAAATLVATAHLPDWGQYLAYVRALLLGGQVAQLTYGFASWSPALAVGAGALASAAAILLLVRRAPAVVRREPAALLALTGLTAYAIALFSYTDNRSSTYLLPYVTLPTLIAGALWLSLLLRSPRQVSRGARLGSLGFGLAVAVLMIAAAWPLIGDRFSRSALAHAYPGGGLTAALQRLWHPPPIDPRAPEGERLLDRYVPGKRALILLPASPDLGTEILIRSKRANRLFIGDPKADAFVRSDVWTSKITNQIAALRSGDRVLMDRSALAVLATFRAHPSLDPLEHPAAATNKQLDWILWRISARFRLQPIHQDQDGFIVAQLVPPTS